MEMTDDNMPQHVAGYAFKVLLNLKLSVSMLHYIPNAHSDCISSVFKSFVLMLAANSEDGMLYRMLRLFETNF